MDGNRRAPSQERCLLLSKHGHQYVFHYLSGQERELYFALIDCARNPTTTLHWADIFLAMDQVSPWHDYLPVHR